MITMALTGVYSLNCDMETLSQELSAMLRENFGDAVCPVVLVDQTCFSGRDCRYQTDTYQINSYMERGYLTVNLHFFQSGLGEALSVKAAIFPPVNDVTRKARKVFDALETVILSHSNSSS